MKNTTQTKGTETMTIFKQIADRANDWVGHNHTFTREQVESLIWALAMDQDLSDKFSRAVRDMQNECAAEMESVR